ncbi:hypothetical protein [Tardiphaga sp. P9-11]|uniref:hypothetical protein n=1 Tax=Tardiphaga sp. P9-11 TaxID=2024614 RepID=UPI0011F0D7E5|nr:hypothetical protein [Tardiphaga sp. P9-11]
MKNAFRSRDWQYVESVLPNRPQAGISAQGRHLGLSVVIRRKPPVHWDEPYFDEIRARAWEDGMSLTALNREVSAYSCFLQSRAKETPFVADSIPFISREYLSSSTPAYEKAKRPVELSQYPENESLVFPPGCYH